MRGGRGRCRSDAMSFRGKVHRLGRVGAGRAGSGTPVSRGAARARVRRPLPYQARPRWTTSVDDHGGPRRHHDDDRLASGHGPAAGHDRRQEHPEQFVLGQLYYQALKAEGFPVTLNQNIGPTAVILQALANGAWRCTRNTSTRGTRRSPVDGTGIRSSAAAYLAGPALRARAGPRAAQRDPVQRHRRDRSDATTAPPNQSAARSLTSAGSSTLTFGGPPQFEQGASGLPALEQAYGLGPSAFKALEIGVAVPGARPGQGAGGRRRHHRRPADQRRLPATAANPRTSSAGATSSRWRRSGRSRRGPDVRGDDQPGERAADAADDAELNARSTRRQDPAAVARQFLQRPRCRAVDPARRRRRPEPAAQR